MVAKRFSAEKKGGVWEQGLKALVLVWKWAGHGQASVRVGQLQRWLLGVW